MIVLISDLHLSDCAERTTIDVERLLDYLRSSIIKAQKSKVTELTLVLLGDIFEVLRSERWLENHVRPWEICSVVHRDTVTEIVKRIVSANAMFFETLQSLTKTHDFVRLKYLPGNHDRPLNTEMGENARELIRSALPLQGSDKQLFSEQFLDRSHRLLAHHGHEWDPENRYSSGLAALGDAVVIEFVLHLPFLVREKLAMDEKDIRLDFLYEMDNIRPHSPKLFVQWIDASQADIKKSHPDFAHAVEKALDEVESEFALLTRTVPFESYKTAPQRMRLLTTLLRQVKKRIGYKRIARLLHSEVESDPYFEFASHDLRLAQDRGEDLLYLVCGHTHHPKIIPLSREPATDYQPRFYFNTGTWRRVRREAHGSTRGGPSTVFSCWQEECAVTIYNKEDQLLGFPPYEFYRITRGAQHST